MKTAMQELLEELNDINSGNPFIQTTINLVKDLVESKLEKEKEQIINASTHGANFDKSPFKNAKDYYNQTFKKS